jgi:hypothetical protein
MKAKCKPLEPINVSLECKDLINITPNTYIMNANDCVIENGELRVKRKYGKFKRPVYKMNYEEKEINN